MSYPRDSDPAQRRLFLLSLWREAEGAPWRAMLRASDSEARIAFPDLEALALFLLRMASEADELPEAGERGCPEAP
jgi:hypothetical protein